jgi:glycerophosphoryl diester phosphodiesterase
VGVVENTMSAFVAAAAAGADGVELDVRLARTGEIVVLHDVDLARVTDGRDPRKAEDLSAVELGRVDLAGEGVPLLATVLDFARERGLLVNVEMKRDVPDRKALVARIARLLSTWDPDANIVVSSFDPVMLAAIGALVPRVPRALLVHRSSYHDVMSRAPALVGAVGVHAEHVLVDAARMRTWASRAFVCSWTVNSGNDALALAALGVHGIITDDPARILSALSRG